MNSISHKLLGILLTMFSLFFMNSCVDSACTRLQCQNGASCIDDMCHCPPGYEGHECQIYSNSKFVGLYVGHSKCEGFPQKVDTVEIFNMCNPNKIILATGIGNTSILDIPGTCKTPEATFQSYEDENVIVNPYVRVDANQLQLTVVSINKRDGMRFVCEFEGRRVPNTDVSGWYSNPRFENCP